MNDKDSTLDLEGIDIEKTYSKTKKGCRLGCLVSCIGMIAIIIFVMVIGSSIFNTLFPSPPTKNDIQNSVIKNKSQFENAVICIREIKKHYKYIDGIEYSKYYTPDNASIKGLFTGGLSNGEYVETPLVNKTIEELFLKAGVRHIYIYDNCIDFAFDGAGRNYYCGAIWTYDTKPVGFQGGSINLITDVDGRGWGYKEVNGNNRYYTQKIIGNWYYYEAWF